MDTEVTSPEKLTTMKPWLLHLLNTLITERGTKTASENSTADHSHSMEEDKEQLTPNSPVPESRPQWKHSCQVWRPLDWGSWFSHPGFYSTRCPTWGWWSSGWSSWDRNLHNKAEVHFIWHISREEYILENILQSDQKKKKGWGEEDSGIK